MKRLVIGGIVLSATLGVIALSCMNREPGPVCPVPVEVSSSADNQIGYDGVDLLVIVDNSGSMEEEQAILATGFFTLINSLVSPTSDWNYEPVGNMRVAVTTSDMGLQYGGGLTDDQPDAMPGGCNAKGDDGNFQAIDVTGVEIESGTIVCDENGDQCPVGFLCQDGDKDGVFYCEANDGSQFYRIECPDALSTELWAETTEDDPNSDFATEISCLSAQGIKGCGIEQQLQAGTRGLERNGSTFLKETHLLAALVVSDEEDCSIKDPGLFVTPEWESGPVWSASDPTKGHLNTACNYPEQNDTNYLYDPESYYQALVDAKGGNSGAVIFAAIVGVPDGEDSPCQGTGNEIGDCLDSPEMQLNEELFPHPTSAGNYFYGFTPACERFDTVTGEELTTARPGRRYVKLAEEFGGNSYVYSICNENWGKAMERIAEVIADAIGAQCYPKSLEWDFLTETQIEEQAPGCENCGEAKCNMLAALDSELDANNDPTCPEGLEQQGNSSINVDLPEGTVKRVFCKVPNIPTPLYCDQALAYLDTLEINEPGWYYCENRNLENFDEACSDNVDNDKDGLADCEDTDCAGCQGCSDEGGTCTKNCMYAVEMNQKAKDLTFGKAISIQCLQQINFEDENCQENTAQICNNEVDDDGNGLMDCEDGVNHFADPNCCPLTVHADETCTPKSSFPEICPGVSVTSSDTNSETACEAHARMLKCRLIE